MSLRFEASDESIRPLGRAPTSGVKGHLVPRRRQPAVGIRGERLSTYVFTVTDGGYAKRTGIDDYRCRAGAASASRR